MDSAYVDEQGPMESKRAYKRRVYNTLYHISRGETGIKDMRITKIWPNSLEHRVEEHSLHPCTWRDGSCMV